MSLFSVFIISLVEGFTEFLPVSFTGHMIIVSAWLNIAQNEKVKSLKVMI